jgi:hypothetical protein
MAYREGFNFKYPASGMHSSAGEDSILAHQLCEKNNRVVLLNGMGYLQVYSFHGKNVWDIDHHAVLSARRSESIGFMQQHQREIVESLNYFRLSPEVKVMGRNGLAFTYKEGDDS